MRHPIVAATKILAGVSCALPVLLSVPIATAGVNPPQGTDGTLILAEETNCTIRPADFGFTDPLDSPADRFTSVLLASPDKGTLRLEGELFSAPGAIPVTPVLGYVWTRYPIERPNNMAPGVAAISPDGTRLLFADYAGYLHRSGDGGATWTQVGGRRAWTCVAFSGDGQKAVAGTDEPASSPGGIFVSQDAGLTWQEHRLVTSDVIRLKWTGVASSLNGQRLVVCSEGGGIFRSYNGGTSWISANGGDFTGIASSADGMRLAAAANEYLLISTDGGLQWTTRLDWRGWKSISSSDDGLRLVAGAYDGSLARSSDGGLTWTLTNLGEPIQHTSSSPDGRVLLAAGTGLWMSTDYGAAWTRKKAAGSWTSVAIARNGGHIAAVKSGDFSSNSTNGLYISRPDIPVLTYTPPANGTGDPYASLTFQVGDDGMPSYDPTPNTLTFRVTNVNDPPVLAVPLPDHNAPAGKLFSWRIPENTFTDPDPGTVFSFAAVKGDGTSLPGWLTFSAASRTFSGTPALADRAVLQVRVTATDEAGVQVSDDFVITVGGLPRGADREITILEDTSYTFTWEDFGFTDPDDLPPDAFTGIRLTSVPILTGSLAVDGVRLWAPGEFVPVLPDARKVWTQIRSGVMFPLVCSADGMTLFGANNPNEKQIDVSIDGGATWQRRNNDFFEDWSALAVSGDGKVMCAAGAGRGYIHLSTDSGDTWTKKTGVRGSNSMALSAGGAKIIAAASGFPLSRSEDSGATWQELPSGSLAWRCVASSADGLRLFAVADGGEMAVSSDSGASWTVSDSENQWSSCACSADGMKLIACPLTGFLHVSHDQGQSWSQRADVKSWVAVASSSDGVRLVAVSSQIYTSTDAGASWNPRTSIPGCSGVACSADGLKLFTSERDSSFPYGAVWASVAAPSTLVFTPGENANGSPGSSFTFQVHDDGVHGVNVDSVPRTIRINVLPVNDAPVPGPALPLVKLNETSPPGYAVPNTAFTDADSGTVLAWSARLASGEAMPPWLAFNPATRVFTTSRAYPGFHDIVITVTDDGNPPLSATAPLAIEVVATDDPPSGGDFQVFTPEDVPYLFKTGDFHFSDSLDQPPHAFSGIRIASLPSNATLTVDDAPAAAGDFVRLNSGPAGETWTATTGSAGRQWYSVAASADGQRLAAVEHGGRIHVSSDGGATWTARGDSAGWYGICSSADGMKLAAVVLNGRIFTSADAGLTWTATAHVAPWRAIASSSDGQRLAAIVYNGQLHTSADGGVTWTAQGTDQPWYGIASSADGSRLVAAVRNGRLFTSSDSGLTWIARDSVRNWRDVASSASGSLLAAIVEGGQIFISLDGGVIWRPRDSNRNWFDIASSADGKTLAAVVQNGRIYTSRNNGIDWTAVESSRLWRTVTVSQDGKKMLAGVNPGPLYQSDSPPPRSLRLVPAANWSGVTNWSFQVEDSGPATKNLDTTPNNVRIVVGSVNDPPTLDPVPDTPLIHASDGEKLVSLTGISAGGNESQSLTVTAVSSDPDRIPAPAITYTSPSSSGELRFTPVPDATGAVTITVRVQDSGGAGFSRTFTVFLITPFQQWAVDNGIPTDPAANGGGNLLRFAFGLAAHTPGLGQMEVNEGIVAARGGPAVLAGNGQAALIFARRKGSLLTITPQFSSSLNTWEDGTTASTAVVAEDELIEACRIEFPEVLSDGKPPRFARLAISTP